MSKNSSHLNALHEKLDALSNQISHEEEKSQKSESEQRDNPEPNA